ncbi:MAG: hypothetical protein KUG83_00595 [Gammaproteobacteria bacterium]|nr:hypothetical protein [Gammaproteobacteria bacterium]
MALFGVASFEERQLERRLEFDKKALFKKVDEIPHLLGAGVVYIDSHLTIVELRKFEPICQISPIKVVFREPPRQMSQQAFAAHLKGSQSDARESKLVGEVAGAVLSCGAAVIGWLVVTGSAAAIPLSVGTSAGVSYLAIGAAVASSLQCLNGLARTSNEVDDPSINDALDSEEWYRVTTVALDVMSLAGAAAAAAVTVKGVKLLQASGVQSTKVLLQGLSRAEKKRLTQEIIRMNEPSTRNSNAVLKRLINTGAYPKRYSGTKISKTMVLQLKDAVGATMSFAGSASSGVVKALAIGVYEETVNQ